MNRKIDVLLERAGLHIDQAKEEFNKPEEDVVPYIICKNSNDAVRKYLSSYLLSNEENIPRSGSIRDMITACRRLESGFNDLQLSPFYNPADTEDLWMNIDMATDFLTMAERTRDMVTPLIKTSKV